MFMPDNRIQELREAKRWSQADLAEAIGTSPQQIGRLEAGKRKLTVDWMTALAQALGVGMTELLAPDRGTVPLVGIVGAGAVIFSVDDHMKGGGLEEVERPVGASRSTVAVKVRGDSMKPAYRDGDVLYYDTQTNSDFDQLIGHDCIVRLADGRCLVKELRKNGVGYWLHSYNADPIIGANIEWAAKIKWVLKA